MNNKTTPFLILLIALSGCNKTTMATVDETCKSYDFKSSKDSLNFTKKDIIALSAQEYPNNKLKQVEKFLINYNKSIDAIPDQTEFRIACEENDLYWTDMDNYTGLIQVNNSKDDFFFASQFIARKMENHAEAAMAAKSAEILSKRAGLAFWHKQPQNAINVKQAEPYILDEIKYSENRETEVIALMRKVGAEKNTEHQLARYYYYQDNKTANDQFNEEWTTTSISEQHPELNDTDFSAIQQGRILLGIHKFVLEGFIGKPDQVNTNGKKTTLTYNANTANPDVYYLDADRLAEINHR